jgi:hypothetical protein
MCYNHRTVETVLKQTADRVREKVALSSAQQAAALPAGKGDEDVSRYCPVCSQRLESRRCKLICAVCGYYMSCADYY